MNNIPFFNYQQFSSQYGDALKAIFADILNRGAYILQQDMRNFEKNFANYLSVKHAIAVGNCTDGLLFALKAAGVKAGDEVIFPSHTFVASASAIYHAGATPVPVECGDDHLMDPAAIENAITSKTVAILPVQLNGRTCEMDKIQAIADRHKLMIIEDAAQGLGSTFKGQKAGTFGLAAAFSFYPAKLLGCLGDGGMVVTNDDAMAEKIALQRDHGRVGTEVLGWGMNSRLDNLQAAILDYMLTHFDKAINTRRSLAACYHQHLKQVPELKLPPAPDVDACHFDVYQNYEIECQYRDELKSYLANQGVGTIIQWGGKTVHMFKNLNFTQILPKTEAMINSSLLLPMNASVTLDDVATVCFYIVKFYEKRRGIGSQIVCESYTS